MQTKLEILSAYLPYKLMCLVDGIHISRLTAVYEDGSCVFYDLVESSKGFKSIKPVLKPMSDIDWKNFIDLGYLLPDSSLKFIDCFNENNNNKGHLMDIPLPLLRWCLKYHFDVFGLIESGEAVSDWQVQNIDL